MQAGTRTEAFPRMRAYVERPYAAGVPLAVASGSSLRAIEAVLRRVGLTDRFAAVVSAEEVARGRPSRTSSWRRRDGAAVPGRPG